MPQIEDVRPDSGTANADLTSSSHEKKGLVSYATRFTRDPINFNVKPEGEDGRGSLMPGELVELVSLQVDIDALRRKYSTEFDAPASGVHYPLWLQFAFDMSTFSMLAMDYYICPPDAQAWRYILAMCGMDKDHIADRVGAERNWKNAAVPRMIVTDRNNVFSSDGFRKAVMFLGAAHAVPPNGYLRSKAAIEGMIRYAITSFLRCEDLREWITPELSPMEHAVGRALLRAVIDHYQSEPMNALSGTCPDLAWKNACRLHGPPRRLSDNEVRIVVKGLHD